MRLSSKGRYGVRALFHIAFHNHGRPTQTREIAARERIPIRFLEQIFQDLKRAKLVSAKRGPRGGYHLSRGPERITVGEVVRAVEGEIAVVKRGGEPDLGGAEVDPIASVFFDIAAGIERCFDEVTLSDVCDRARAMGVTSEKGFEPDYAI